MSFSALSDLSIDLIGKDLICRDLASLAMVERCTHEVLRTTLADKQLVFKYFKMWRNVMPNLRAALLQYIKTDYTMYADHTTKISTISVERFYDYINNGADDAILRAQGCIALSRDKEITPNVTRVCRLIDVFRTLRDLIVILSILEHRGVHHAFRKKEQLKMYYNVLFVRHNVPNSFSISSHTFNMLLGSLNEFWDQKLTETQAYEFYEFLKRTNMLDIALLLQYKFYRARA